ncbi:MAG: hypothetical protein C4520_15975 [Candidatus Abyssobacteria bacterium SURF_5]|uniref:Uncharacterized protein n=1 Tax=Abyssobacteria bacterium (strain SURF_5) TaxID=2093360 RepID=A0A3A4NPD6_ABYX5|nr:MAG: hypothetical protein C4520_15975 [Candidatus Abyssubacteria bacterium SURF_5]
MKTPSAGKIFRNLLLGLGAVLALLVISTLIFTHFYFKRTFSHQINGVVIRCSDGILRKSAADWEPLHPGDNIAPGMRIRMPVGRRSLLSFSGIRLLTDGPAEISIRNIRSFSIQSGTIAVAAGSVAETPEIFCGAGCVKMSDSVMRLAAEPPTLACVTGKAILTANGAQYMLEPGSQADLSGQQPSLTSSQLDDPFKRLKVSTLDRIRNRFEEVLAKYARAQEKFQSARAQRPNICTGGFFADGLQFASYLRPRPFLLAQRDAAAVADYYDNIFAPGNRSISIGKQKAIPLTPHFGSSWPMWSHDGSMVAFIEASVYAWQARVRVARLDDLDHPWDISQDHDDVLSFFPIAWAPDNRHVLFMVPDSVNPDPNASILWEGPYHIMIAPIDPAEGPLREFESPFSDLPISLPLPIGKTISPVIINLPWGDALLCANWGNLAYIPIEPDGQAVAGAPGLFLTNFNPRKDFIAGGIWSPSGSKILFAAAEDLRFDNGDVFILNDVEDILDGLALPPRTLDDPRIKRVASSKNFQIPGSFSYDESLVFFQEDVNGAWTAWYPALLLNCDFDLFYADARPDQPSKFTQIHLPGNQMFLRLSPEGNRVAYSYANHPDYELRVVSFDIEADMDTDLGGVLIDNSGTTLIVPPGALEENFKVKISTPFTIEEEAEVMPGETPLFAMRMLDAQGLEKPKFIEPMTLTIRYTDDEVAGLDEGMLEIYYYDESDPAHPAWVPLGGTVDPEHNEITIDIQHFSSFSVGLKNNLHAVRE